MKYGFAFLFLTVLAATFATAPASAASHAGWKTFKGDLVEYHQVGLPDPTVIYIYNAAGQLVRLINTHGNFDAKSLNQVALDLSVDVRANAVAEDLKDKDQSLKRYFFDQGLALADVVDRKNAYSLVLVEWDSGKVRCQPCEAFENTIDKVVRSSPSSKYHVVVLQLGSPLLRFNDAK
jgi:hypothetical protein